MRPEVLVVDAGRFGFLQPNVAFELMSDIGREVVDDDVRRALLQLEASHDVVGNHLEDQAFVFRPAVEVIVIAGELDAIVGEIANEPIRSGADGMFGQRRAGPIRDNRHHEIDGKRRERLVERESHGVPIGGIDRFQLAVAALSGRHEVGVEKAPKRVHHVRRRQLVAVLEAHTAFQLNDVGGRRRLIQPLGQLGHDAHVLVELHEVVEDQRMDFLGRVVEAEPRVEVVGGRLDADDEHVRIDRLARAASGRHDEQEHADESFHSAASFLSSVRSANASSGVIRSTSSAARRVRSRSSIGRRLKQPELLLGIGGRRRDRRAAAAGEFVTLERTEDLARAVDDGGRQAGQPRDLYPVAAVRSARHDLTQEDDVILPLAGGDVEVDHAGGGIGQVRQFVIVRGEERLGPEPRIRRQMLGDGPRNAQAVEGGRAAADFVEHDETARRRMVQDVGGFLHFDHEGGMAAGDVVGCADARKNAVDERHFGFARRHERSDLRHDDHERGLPQVRGLAAHVRSREDDKLRRRAVQRDVVGHKRFAGRGRPALDDRMARVDDRQFVAVVDVRLDVVVGRRCFGERRQDVDGGQCPRRGLDPGRLGRHRQPEPLEDLELALEDALVGAQHLLLVFLQRRRDEPLAAGDGLLAVIVGGHGAKIRFRDLDVVPEDAVVADLEGGDAGADALSRLPSPR